MNKESFYLNEESSYGNEENSYGNEGNSYGNEEGWLKKLGSEICQWLGLINVLIIY